MIIFRCPNCGSKRVWERVSVLAKFRVNSPDSLPYDIQRHSVDNQYEGDCGCDKCGWEGAYDDFRTEIGTEKKVAKNNGA